MNYKMSVSGYIYRLFNIILLCVIVNSFIFVAQSKMWYINLLSIALFVIINIFPSFAKKGYNSFRLRMCEHGNGVLIYFVTTTIVSLIFNISTAFYMIPDSWFNWLINALICILYESILFWHGIIAVYCTSLQLGIKIRVIGLLCGWIPIANIFALGVIIRTVSKEVNFEIGKSELNKSRCAQQICATKYPILLVHGVFFRDTKFFNYWGRVPKELEKNGATIYYGNHQSALSVEDSAKELAERIEQIVKETGCEKVNIIAHSKGGLDCRYAVSKLGLDKYVASIITINTPHRGCGFADYLLNKVPENTKNTVANAYNSALRKFGDKSPDFLASVSNLTEEYCTNFNKNVPDIPSIHYISVGSKLNHATNGKFPLSFSYNLVKHFDGANDGLVSEKSFQWGEKYTFVTVDGKRGVSHGDMIDLNRENIDGFDVREFYVQLVSELKQMGL